jgi:hypothetical protein
MELSLCSFFFCLINKWELLSINSCNFFFKGKYPFIPRDFFELRAFFRRLGMSSSLSKLTSETFCQKSSSLNANKQEPMNRGLALFPNLITRRRLCKSLVIERKSTFSSFNRLK